MPEVSKDSNRRKSRRTYDGVDERNILWRPDMGNFGEERGEALSEPSEVRSDARSTAFAKLMIC